MLNALKLCATICLIAVMASATLYAVNEQGNLMKLGVVGVACLGIGFIQLCRWGMGR